MEEEKKKKRRRRKKKKTKKMFFILPSLLCIGSIVLTFISVHLISMKHKAIRATENTIFS